MAAAVKLVVGNVVKLASEGPWMTVVKDRLDGNSKGVLAAWFDGSKLEQEVFPKEALVPHPSVLEAQKAKEGATKE